MKKTKHFGLIGHNIGYSRSEAIFKAIYDYINISGRYEIFDIEPDAFDREFPKILKSGVSGLSVTIPYKIRVMSFLDDIAPVAKAMQAVNSIHITDTTTTGLNTDCYGFSLPLMKYAEKLKHGRAIVLGCGGAAKAVVYSLGIDFEVKEFVVVGRSVEKLRKFSDNLHEVLPNIAIHPKVVSDYREHNNGHYDIVVNCTPAGGWNHPDDIPFPDQFRLHKSKIFYDLNYNTENQLLNQAREAEMVCIDGSVMLVGQGIRSFYHWTGEQVPLEPIYRQVFETHD